MELEEQTLQEVLQQLMWYFAKSRIQDNIMETQLVQKDQVGEVNDEEQDIRNKEIMEEKKRNFKAQDPLVEVNLGSEEELRMTKVRSLLLEEI